MGAAEQALTNGNVAELAQTLFEESGDALFLFDPESEQLIEVNPTGQRLSGYSRRDLLRVPVSYLFRCEVRGGLAGLRNAYRKTGLFHSREGFFLRHRTDGRWIAVNLTVTRLHAVPRTLGLITARDITERRESQLAVQRSEGELRRVLGTVSAYVWSAEVAPDGTYLARYYSPDVEKVTGRPASFFMPGPQRWFECVHPDDRPRIEAAFRRLESGDVGEDVDEYRLIRADGATIWVNANVVVSTRPDGGARRWDGVVIDVTLRRRAQEAVRSSEHRFRTLVEHIGDALVLLDEGGKIVFASQSSQRVLGSRADQLVARELLELVHPEDATRTRAFLDRAPGAPQDEGTFEFRCPQTGGGWRLVEATLQDRLSDPHVRAIVCTCRDVTERRRGDEAVRTSEAKYRSLVENLEQSIFVKDTSYRFLAVNRPFVLSLGCREEAEVLGRTDEDFFPPEYVAKYRADDTLVLTEGRRLEVEEQYLYCGKLRTIRTVKTPVRDGHGQIVAVQGIFWDVTEQRTVESQLLQAQKMEAVGHLAGGIAHDFNNLLTAALGNLSLLLSGLPVDDPNRELAVAAERAASRAATVTTQLLGFSRQTVLRPQPLRLEATVEEVTSLLRRTIDPRVVIEARTHNDTALVNADPGQMTQVLMNLCLNARDAMPEGGRLLIETENVALSQEHAHTHLEARPGDFVRLRVSDTGAGIPHDVRARIFEPFFTTKGPGKGTGLGLAMVFGILKQHQGWVECATEPGHGARFDAYLPRAADADCLETTALTEPPGRGHERILFADDEQMLRQLGRMILEKYGYKVDLAEDGQDALERYTASPETYDLVILDLTMPRLSGRDAFLELLEVDPDVRVVFSSGYSAESLTDLDQSRAKGFVAKPYRPEEMARCVRQALDA